jgi:LuxR family transcriptional regulator, maltose regulon positive regulatory protein
MCTATGRSACESLTSPRTSSKVVPVDARLPCVASIAAVGLEVWRNISHFGRGYIAAWYLGFEPSVSPAPTEVPLLRAADRISWPLCDGTYFPGGGPDLYEMATLPRLTRNGPERIRALPSGDDLPAAEAEDHKTASAAEEITGMSRVVLRELFDTACPPKRSERQVAHPDLITRTALLDWFSAHRDEPLLAVFAPAGYGKTTLLGQAAEADVRPVAWVSLKDGDNDPLVLMTRLAEGLDRIVKVDPLVLEALRLPANALWSTTVPRLGAAFASIQRPSVIVLDDAHLIRDRDCLDIVTALCACVPEGSQLVLAGRAEPQLGLSRARAQRRLAELGRDQLALDAIEAGALLSAAGVDLTGLDVAELTRRTEGWPAGLYLIALSLRAGGSLDRKAVAAVNSQDGHIADYLRSEVLSRLKVEEVEFLTRTAVLERMCGPLCDAVLKQTASAAMLETLERSNHFVAPHHDRGWYCDHHLFRELLAHELERREPGMIPTLNRRAAAWYEQSGAPETAIEYAFAGGDLEHAARLLTACEVEMYQSGRLDTVCRWLDRLDQADLLERHPELAIFGAWAQGLSGHPAQAERWADVAERGSSEGPLVDGSATIEPWEATLRASICRHGGEEMRADAERALRLAPEWSFWRSTASLSLGISFVISGDEDRADDVFADTVEMAQEVGMTDDRSVALAERSLLAAARGDVRGAEQFAQEALRVVVDAGLDEYMTSAISYAALGKVALGRRDLKHAREHFGRSDRLRPLLTWFMPTLAVQVRLELVRERLASADPVGAEVLLREIDQLLRRVPALGVLAEQAGELRGHVAAMRTISGDAARLLSDAELRVLPLLATHLNMAEIAERQFVSRATVKTQAISIYRKLDVTSRSEAVERAAEVGLIDSAAVPPRRDFHLSA